MKAISSACDQCNSIDDASCPALQNHTTTLIAGLAVATPPTWSIASSAAPQTSDLDLRLTFLARADAQFALIEAGELSVDEAFDGLMPALLEIADCRCYREILEKFDEAARDQRNEDRRDHRRDDHDHEDAAYRGRAAASTVEALKYELRTYGIEQLKKPPTEARIAELSAEQMTDLIAGLHRIQSAYPQITDELVDLLQQVPK